MGGINNLGAMILLFLMLLDASWVLFSRQKIRGARPPNPGLRPDPCGASHCATRSSRQKGETWGVMKSNTWDKNLFQRQGFVGDYYRLVNFKLQFDAVLATQSA